CARVDSYEGPSGSSSFDFW
nr:immunoglobulin heavy chain junction region [Macaca mulatta]MOW75838.1 immunoglobulin heavy chain junction region [Macaca mulatta]MOW76148.1 immunoglobulin heavy chain junction region [Macaca mulatta]MOW76507.1 immunoglobulin heavy chain junction region [Macaca mulatta]MOW76762.1 immunoglobulin heavy chain junction region [Macaca mulatta]